MTLRQLHVLLIFTLLVAPVLSIIQGVWWSKTESELPISELQLVRGFLMMLILCLLMISAAKVNLNGLVISPILYLCLYALLLLAFFPYPWFTIVWSFKPLFCCVIFIGCYVLTDRSILKGRHLVQLAWAILVLTLLSQLIGYMTGVRVSRYDSEYSTAGLAGLSATVAALSAALIPIFLLSGRWRSKDVIAILLCLISVGLVMRRSAFIAAFSSLFTGDVIRLFKSHSSIRTAVLSLILPLCLLAVFLYALQNTAWGKDFSNRLEELDPSEGGTASGRYEFEKIALDYVLHRGVVSSVVGEGMGRSMDITEAGMGRRKFTHNDWLEIPIAFGIMGLFFFILFHVRALKSVYDARTLRGGYLEASASLLVTCIVLEVTAGGIFDPNTAIIFATLGYISGASQNAVHIK